MQIFGFFSVSNFACPPSLSWGMRIVWTIWQHSLTKGGWAQVRRAPTLWQENTENTLWQKNTGARNLTLSFMQLFLLPHPEDAVWPKSASSLHLCAYRLLTSTLLLSFSPCTSIIIFLLVSSIFIFFWFFKKNTIWGRGKWKYIKKVCWFWPQSIALGYILF